MQFHSNILICIFVFLIAKSDSFDDTGGYSSSLERKLMLKLKTATRLKHNFGKILQELPVWNYELYHSIKSIEDYLKNGGSLIECLNNLSSMAYASIEKQIDIILEAMENYLPKYLIPAISLLKRFISEGILDADEIYRPTWGPPKSDPLEKISLRELKEATLPLIYREPVNDFKGPWPKIVGETASLINHKIILPRQELIAYILANLRIPDATSEIRELVLHLIEHLQLNGKRELTGFRTSSDPYELMINAFSSLSLRNESLTAMNVLLPFLKKPSECRHAADLVTFFQNNAFNYTQLILQAKIISTSTTDMVLLLMNQQKNQNAQDFIEQFFSFEYTSWKDLLLAFLSQFRRHQKHQDIVSDIVDNVYGDLILKSTQKHWQLLRNRVTMGTIFSAMSRRQNSARIQRILTDVATDRSIESKVWRKALAFDSSEDVGGPIDAALKTLKALLMSGLIPSGVLKTNIAELVNIYNKSDQVLQCNDQLETHLANFTSVRKSIVLDEKTKIMNIDIEDLLQALPDLDIFTDEYRSFKNFLSRDDLEAKIGQVDVSAHSTRGRLLSQLLQMMKYANDIDDNPRYIATQFVNNVTCEGYGAGALLHRFS